MATTKNNDTAATLGFEARLWAADALRDTLLPKLVSGEPQVKEAERFVEETV